MNRTEMFSEISATLVDMFQLDPEIVTPTARLVEDLDLDSIDAVDMAAKMQELTGKRLDEDDLRGLTTVQDVVDVVEKMLHARSGETVDQT